MRLLLTDRQRGAIASLAKELTCPVCNDFLEHPHSLRCGHTFCQYCVQEAFRGKMACPECNLPAWGNDLRPSPLFGNLVEKFRDLKEAAGDMISQNVADDEEDEGAEEGQDNRRSSGNGIDAANSSITDDDINGDDDRDRYNNNDSDDKENEMQFEHVQGKRAPFAAGEQRGQREAPAEEGEEEGEEEGQMLIEEEGGEEVFRPTQEIVSDSKELIASRQNLLDRFDDSNLAHAPRDGPHKEVGVSESNNATVSAASHSRQLGTGQKTRGNSHDNIDGVEDSKSRRIQKRRRRESGGEAEEGDSGAHPGPAFSGSPLEQTSSTTSQSSRRAEKIFLVGTSLSKASRKALRKLKGITTRQVAGKEDEVAGGKVETEAEEQGQERSVRVVVKKAVDARTTHLVARAVEGDRCKRTIKFFLAMAFGCRIVSSEWINACHEAKAVVPEESYYIKCGVNDQASCNGPCRARQLRAQGKRVSNR